MPGDMVKILPNQFPMMPDFPLRNSAGSAAPKIRLAQLQKKCPDLAIAGSGEVLKIWNR